MKKMSFRMVMMAMLLCTMLVTPTQVKAAENGVATNVEVDGSILTMDTESTVVVYPRARGIYLLTGSGTITQIGTGLVGVSGSTTATMVVSSLKVATTLQRYSGGSWVSVDGWSKTAYNTNHVSISNAVTVTRGYYYRVLSNHWVLTDWTQGATNGIWIA